MLKEQKKRFFRVATSLAHILSAGYQPNLNCSNRSYENKTYLCIVSTQKQSTIQVSCPISQVHLYPRQKSVFQNILSCIMDQRYIYTI